jgi:ER membrane protein complex subunit 2
MQPVCLSPPPYSFPSPLTFSRYTYALQSLSHVLLLNPQNPFYVLQAAETAYTADDVPLSIKMFLMVIEMTGEGEDDPRAKPQGIAVRAWYGVRLVRISPLLLETE